MRRLFLILIIIILSGAISQAQSSMDLVNGYIEAYAKKRKFYKDTTLIYVPMMVNIYENCNSWYQLSVKGMRDCFFEFFSHPVLANDMALSKITEDYYLYPHGYDYKSRYYNKEKPAGPCPKDGWYYQTVVLPLIRYLQHNHVDYMFTISNVGFKERDHCFWTIEQGQLYVLRWSDTNDEYYRVDADLFINDIAEDGYFKFCREEMEK